MTTITQTIDAIDNPPSIDDPANFEAEADDFLTSQLPGLQAQLNTFAGQMNTVASEVNANADTASAASTTATTKSADAAASAGTAGTAATTATTKAGEAASSATAAESYAASAYSYLQAYRATSYGAAAEDPTVDPNGNPPTVGDEYFNTTSSLLKRFNGATWVASDISTANLAAPTGAELVGFQPPGADAAATTLELALDRLFKPRVDGSVSRKIVFAGSSVAAGNNATSANGWAQQVGTALTARGWSVAHASVGGNTTQLLLDRFHSDVIVPHAPDICVIALSLNNEGIQSSGTTSGKEAIYGTFLSNLKKLIWLCRQNHIVPVVTGLYPNDGYGTDDYTFIRSANRWLDKQGVTTINWLDTLDDGSGHWKTGLYSDGTHPNDDGHAAMYYCVPISMFEGLLDWSERPHSPMRAGGWATTGTPGNVPIKAVFDTPMRSYTVAFRCATADQNKGIWGVNNVASGNPTRIKTSGGFYILDTGSTTVTSTVAVDGREHHFVVVYDHWDSLIYLYIDGVQIGSTSFQQSETVQWMAFMDRASGGVPVVGTLSEVLVYRTALTDEGVKAIYEGDVPKGSLELQCPLGDPGTALYARAANLMPTASYLFIQTSGVVVGSKGASSKLQNMDVVTSSSADPSTTDVLPGTWKVWKNTTSGTVKLWTNDGGTLKSVALS